MIFGAIDRARLAALRMHGYESRFVQTSIGRVHALEHRGRGPLPALVLLHGLSSAAIDYGPLLRRLRGVAQRIIVPDLPGHGLSDPPPAGPVQHGLRAGLREALDALIDGPAILFGNSLGGLAAIRYAGYRPDRALALMLVSPAAAPAGADERERVAGEFRIETSAQARAFVDRVTGVPHWARNAIAMGVRYRLANPTVQRLLDAFAVGGSMDLEPVELAGLDMPITMLWGKRERVLSPAHREFFERHLPEHASIDSPEHFGHAPFMDDPDAVTDKLLSFAKSVAG